MRDDTEPEYRKASAERLEALYAATARAAQLEAVAQERVAALEASSDRATQLQRTADERGEALASAVAEVERKEAALAQLSDEVQRLKNACDERLLEIQRLSTELGIRTGDYVAEREARYSFEIQARDLRAERDRLAARLEAREVSS